MYFVESENYLQEFEKMTQRVEYPEFIENENNHLAVWSSLRQFFYGNSFFYF
jgi:hypothetical protein